MIFSFPPYFLVDAYRVLYWQLAAILPLALVHTLGNLFTNMSLGKVAVSFTHTIKATEPFFSVLLSAMFLGEVCWIWMQIKLISRNFFPFISIYACVFILEQ